MGDEASLTDGGGEKPVAAPRILIVEDEIIVALFLEDVLAGLGYRVAGVAAYIEEALALDHGYELAILDVHLNGRDVFAFADRLVQRGTPFLFATGYGERGIPERFRGRPVLQKPYVPDDLKRVLDRIAPL